MSNIEHVKELHLGIMTNKELAEWFGGINEKSFRDTRAKKLKILEEYADFDNLWGKVNIKQIYKPIYIKAKSYNFIKEKTQEQWDKTGLDTCKFVANKIKKNYPDKLTVADSTLYTYTCNSKRELWGKANSSGEIGKCVYEICKVINNKCIELTEEETQIKNELLNKYYGNSVSENLIYIAKMIKDGEITENECWEEIQRITDIENKYLNFKCEFEEKIGTTITRATRVDTSAFGEKKQWEFDF